MTRSGDAVGNAVGGAVGDATADAWVTRSGDAISYIGLVSRLVTRSGDAVR